MHWIDYRVSIPFFGGRYYLTVFFGKERRQLSRIKLEGQASVMKASVVYIIAGWVLISLLFMVLAATVYMVKSVLGLDMFEDPSVFHSLFYRQP